MPSSLNAPFVLSFLTRRSYEGEEGIDAGGVFKDWLGSISRELLKPGALFLPCLSASGLSVRCLRLNPLPSELGVANEAQVRALGILCTPLGASRSSLVTRRLRCCACSA